VMVSQLYQELYEFSYSLLLYRLAETALGAAVTIAVVTLVFPLRTRRVLRVAFRNHIRAVETLVEHASEVLTTAGPARGQDRLGNDARAVDASYQTLVTTAQPLRRSMFGTLDEGIAGAVRLASATRNFSQALVADLASTAPLGPGFKDEIGRTLPGRLRALLLPLRPGRALPPGQCGRDRSGMAGHPGPQADRRRHGRPGQVHAARGHRLRHRPGCYLRPLSLSCGEEARPAPNLAVADRTGEVLASRFEALNALDIPWVDSEDVAEAVLWLASHETRPCHWHHLSGRRRRAGQVSR